MSDQPAPLLPPSGAGLSPSQTQWAIAIHLSAFLGLLGVTNVIGPLVIWLFKRPESSYLDAVGKRVLNFQISWLLYLLVASGVVFVLTFVLIGFLLAPLIGVGIVVWAIFTIIGAVKESGGETYRFPLSIQFFR